MDLQPWVDDNREKFNALVPETIQGGRERFLRNMVFQVGANPAIRDCSKQSIIKACLEATLLQLDIGVLGQAYLVPYNTKAGKVCQMIPGYRGLLALARRSGKLRAVHSEIVCAEDTYERTEDHFSHSWDPFRDRGPMIGAYTIFEMEDGSRQYETMSLAEIETVRSRSRAGHAGPWVTDFGEMAKKTTMRRGLKKLDLRVEALDQVLAVDNRQYEDAEVDVREPARSRGGARLAEALSAAPSLYDDVEVVDEEEPSESPGKPSAEKWPWKAIQEGMNAVAQNLGIKTWSKLSAQRKKLVQRRAHEEGWTPTEFVSRTQDVLMGVPKTYMSGWSESGRTLEVLLRVPSSSTKTDHFRLLSEIQEQSTPTIDPGRAELDRLLG